MATILARTATKLKTMPEPLPEPWLRGLRPPVDPIVAPALFALQQVREDLKTHTSGITDDKIWDKLHNIPTLGFHLCHIAGSLDRLTSYLEGRPLTGIQLTALQAESEAGAGLAELLANIDTALRRTEDVISAVDPATYAEPRTVGRKKLPTTVIGLIIHIAEHTQRHCGQAITTAALLRD
jgi:hypothetical protein